MSHQDKPAEAIKIAGKRKHLRASTREKATLHLEGIGAIEGHADDIGFGGVFFTAERDLADIPVGATGTIAFTMFNTLVDLNCRVAACRQGGLGIEIQRHYSTDELKEKVHGITTQPPGKRLEWNGDEVTHLLQQTSAFLRQLAAPGNKGYAKSEAELLADKMDDALAALSNQ
ncbi:MAG: hypothetical protein HQL79_09145 [Magnetococcales bacterium]|nr:hypothetical protein [Magnetococcales bacterium]